MSACQRPLERLRCLEAPSVRPAPHVTRWLVLEPRGLAPLGRQTEVAASVHEQPAARQV